MRIRKIILTASALAASACGLALTSQPASARVVCNRFGDCWRTHEVVRYPRDLRVHAYSDRYADEAYRERRWRRMHRVWHNEDHDHDRGAWRNGAWVTF